MTAQASTQQPKEQHIIFKIVFTLLYNKYIETRQEEFLKSTYCFCNAWYIAAKQLKHYSIIENTNPHKKELQTVTQKVQEWIVCEKTSQGTELKKQVIQIINKAESDCSAYRKLCETTTETLKDESYNYKKQKHCTATAEEYLSLEQ